MEDMTDLGYAPVARAGRHIVIDNVKLQRLQKRLAMATITIPFVGTIAAVALLFYRPIGLVEVGLLVVMYALTTLGITVGFHRHFAHRAFTARPALRAALGVLGSMAAQGTPIYWVATHRRHHQFSEGDGDPHSPYTHEGQALGRLRGLWHSHLGWMLDSRMTNTVEFAKDLLRDPLVSKINDMYYLWVGLGLAIPTVLGAVLTASWMGGLTGLLWGGMVRVFLAHHAMWTSGSTAHIFGTRPFDNKDKSTNNPLLAVPNLGEAWHNNHHAFPSSALFGLEWWQIDIGGWAIRGFEKLGWAWDVRVPSRQMIAAKKEQSDAARGKVGRRGLEVW